MNVNTISDDVTISGESERALLANRYHVIKQLGAGGMGSVWLAEDTQLDGKLFAIKMLPSILVSNKRAYNQLKTEALVAMKLVHPNIVQIRAFEENNGNPFMVMDYIEGETLDDHLGGLLNRVERDGGTFGGLSEAETIRLLKPIAEALDYAHTEGVVHRDIKPANVMIRKDGRPFIMDFGIAREIQETMTRVTGKMSSGTLMYMSPEQLNGAAPAAPQDVYSFAAMVYECLKGEPPFWRGAIEDQIKNKTPESLPRPVAIAASVMRGLAKNPEERPQNCVDVLAPCCFTAETPPRRDAQGKRLGRWTAATRDVQMLSRTGAEAQRAAASRSGAERGAQAIRRAAAVVVVAFLGMGGAMTWYRLTASGRPAGALPSTSPAIAGAEAPPPLPKGPCESDLTEIVVEAAVRKEKIKGIDQEDGFGLKKESVSLLLLEATEYRRSKAWAQAAQCFTNYVKACRSLEKLDSERQAAKVKRGEAAAARKRAEDVGAVTLAESGWLAVVKVMDDAESRFARQEFVEARRRYEMAASLFETCILKAGEERARRAAAERAKKETRERIVLGICKECHGAGERSIREMCDSCRGKGSVSATRTCAACSGDGTGETRITCAACKGKGKTRANCPVCRDRGSVRCPACNGAGGTFQRTYLPGIQGRNRALRKVKVTCDSCGGHGRERCQNCDGGALIDCAACEGNGGRLENARCSTCKGAGTIRVTNIPCKTCEAGYVYAKRKCTFCGGEGRRPLVGMEKQDPFDGISVCWPMSVDYLPFALSSVMKIPRGWRALFSRLDAAHQDGSQRALFSAAVGEEIGTTGWLFKAYEQKRRRGVREGAAGETGDASEAVLVRTSDGKIVRLSIGSSERIPVGIKANVQVCGLDGTKNLFPAEPGTSFKLDAHTFIVREISLEAVTIENLSDGIKKRITPVVCGQANGG